MYLIIILNTFKDINSLYRLMDYESNEFITLRFPRDNKVFQQFNNKTLEEQETIIRLGSVMQNTGKTRKTALNNAEWGDKLEESNNRISKISNDYDVKIKDYKAQIRKLKDEKKEELESGIKDAIELEKTKYSTALSSADKKVQELSNQIDDIKNEKWEMVSKMRNEFDNKVESIRENNKSYQEKREDEYRKTLSDLADKLSNDDKCKVASNKGKEGEATVKDFLVMSLPKSEIIDVSQKGGAGDLIIQDASKNIMVEVKKYHSANVKTIEVNKFVKDMESNNFTGGIFLSLHRGICNIDNWTIDTIKGKPVVYLCKVADDMENIITAYKIINKLSEINMDWSITEKLKTIETFIKQFVKEKKKKLKMINKFSVDIVNLINLDEDRMNILIDTLKS
jgi:hypothetical protein